MSDREEWIAGPPSKRDGFASRAQERIEDEGYALHTEALRRFPDDALRAAVWCHEEWRSQPDGYELAVRDVAVMLLRRGMDDEEKQTLKIFTLAEYAPAMAKAIEGRHTFTRKAA